MPGSGRTCSGSPRPTTASATRPGRPVTVHLALDDAGGDSAIVEYVRGEMRLHHSPSFTVVTNSPPFAEQLEHLNAFRGFGGEAPLPGTTEAPDRFVRAAYYVERLPEPGSSREAVAGILSVMRNAAQPFGTADPARPNISATIWHRRAPHREPLLLRVLVQPQHRLGGRRGARPLARPAGAQARHRGVRRGPHRRRHRRAAPQRAVRVLRPDAG